LSSAASKAQGAKTQTLNTISLGLAKTRTRIRAIKTGEATGDLNDYYDMRDDLLDQLRELHAQSYNALNDSPVVLAAIASLQDASGEARGEAKKLEELTDGINKFTELLQKVTGIVSALGGLATI